MRITVIGAGSWGTALAVHASKSGHDTVVWAFEKEVVDGINSRHINPLFMSEYLLPETLIANNDIIEATRNSELIISVVPTQFLRSVLRESVLQVDPDVPIISASKGIENETLVTPTVIINEELENHNPDKTGVIAGPSFAKEVITGHPTTVVLSIKDQETAKKLQHELSGDSMRVYRSDDIIGAEYCGALKNIIAIASGTISGLGYGDNTRAALITRGLSEITRLITTMGGKPSTVAGIAGIGDTVLTCTSSTSRNFTVGFRLGQGEKLEAITDSMKMVAEGVKTTKSAVALAHNHGLEMPITEAMYRVLYDGLNPKFAVQQLMTRALKREWEEGGYPK